MRQKEGDRDREGGRENEREGEDTQQTKRL